MTKVVSFPYLKNFCKIVKKREVACFEGHAFVRPRNSATKVEEDLNLTVFGAYKVNRILLGACFCTHPKLCDQLQGVKIG